MGWVVQGALRAQTDRGVQLDFTRDAPSFIQCEVRKAVWRWRWRKLEQTVPALKTEPGGVGAHFHPIFKLLNARPSEQWGPKEQGALRSVVANRQWPQVRLHQAGKATSRNCRLCVAMGLCAEDGRNPLYWGTLLHRMWTCPATAEHRKNMVPAWLLDDVRRAIRADGTMTSAHLALYTRALVASPEALVTHTR